MPTTASGCGGRTDRVYSAVPSRLVSVPSRCVNPPLAGTSADAARRSQSSISALLAPKFSPLQPETLLQPEAFPDRRKRERERQRERARGRSALPPLYWPGSACSAAPASPPSAPGAGRKNSTASPYLCSPSLFSPIPTEVIGLNAA